MRRQARLYLAAALAAGAALTLFIGARLAAAEYDTAAGYAAVARAAALPRSPERDALLAQAHANLTGALAATPGDAGVWRSLARVRLLQATGAQVMETSPALLNAARDAADRAAALDPRDPEAPALAARARSLLAEDPLTIAPSLSESYARAALDPAIAAWRVRVAMEAWEALDGPLRQKVQDEACMLARRSESEREAFVDIAARTPTQSLALMLRGVSVDPRCAPLH